MSEAKRMPSPRWKMIRTTLLVIAMTYVGIILLLVALESKFIFHPTTAKEQWIPIYGSPTSAAVTSSQGDSINLSWLPHKDSSRVVLFSHGNAGNLSFWGRAMNQWRDYLKTSVLIYDYPGYGYSTGSPSEASCYAAAEAAWTWLTEKQAIPPEKITFVGESLGGAMAIELASRHPCETLIVFKTFTSMPDMAASKFPWIPVQYLVRNRFDSLARISQCRRPTFVYHGKMDPLIPFSQGERLYQAAPGPKEIYLDPTGSHDGHLPDDFFLRISSFLQQHAPASQ